MKVISLIMSKKAKSIPVHQIPDENTEGIFIGKVFRSDFDNFSQNNLKDFEGVSQSHRDNYYLFFILQEGTAIIDVDFQHATDIFWAMNSEHLHQEYRTFLENLVHAKPLKLEAEVMGILNQAAILTIKLSEEKRDKPFTTMLRDSCHVLTGLVSSSYADLQNPTPNTRFTIITKTFKTLLEHNYLAAKRPAAYAEMLHISTPYLNECVKHVTGFSVSFHIQQRVILEAKRLLYHSDMSVKEIAHLLGYEDYPYFSRLFTKVVGVSALLFRHKNSISPIYTLNLHWQTLRSCVTLHTS